MSDIELRILENPVIPMELGDGNFDPLLLASGVTESRLQEVLQDYVPKSDIDSTLSITGDVAEAKATGDAIAEINTKLADILPSDSASGAIASFSDGANNFPLKSLEVDIEPKQSGSGTPAPDNVRPITGWNSVSVTRTGKNLLANTLYQYNVGNLTTTAFSLKAGTYTLSFDKSTNPSGLYLRPNASVSATALATAYNAKQLTFTLDKDYDNLIVQIYQNGILLSEVSNLQLEVGSTKTDYEPFTSSSYTIPLPSTVCGGQLNVTTGELLVDRAKIVIDGVNVKMNSVFGSGTTMRPALSQTDAKNASGISDTLANGDTSFATIPYSFRTASTYNIFAFNIGITKGEGTADAMLTTANAWFAQHPTTIVYELKTPTTLTLTPTEVKTLLGDNNIWADSGDVAVVYSADIAKYIDKRIGG